jgi:FkbM family methyltransferase
VKFKARRDRGPAALGDDEFDELARSRGYVKAANRPKLHQWARKRGYIRPATFDDVLAAQRFTVDEVIDVGVHAGTTWLYEGFPDSRFVLVEPIPGGEALLESRPRDYTYVNCGLGAEPGRLTLNRYNNEKLDSFLEMRHFTDEVSERRQLTERVEVPVRTLDEIIEEHCASDNIGIKIDTEGFELDVVKGLDRQKERVTFIIAETSVVRRHQDSYQFSDLVSELHAKGFCFLNVMNLPKKVVQFYDVIFVRKEDPRLDLPVNRIEDLEERDRAARALVLSQRD